MDDHLRALERAVAAEDGTIQRSILYRAQLRAGAVEESALALRAYCGDRAALEVVGYVTDKGCGALAPDGMRRDPGAPGEGLRLTCSDHVIHEHGVTHRAYTRHHGGAGISWPHFPRVWLFGLGKLWGPRWVVLGLCAVLRAGDRRTALLNGREVTVLGIAEAWAEESDPTRCTAHAQAMQRWRMDRDSFTFPLRPIIETVAMNGRPIQILNEGMPSLHHAIDQILPWLDPEDWGGLADKAIALMGDAILTACGTTRCSGG